MQSRARFPRKENKGWRKNILLFVRDGWTTKIMKIAFLILCLLSISYAGRNTRLGKGGNSPPRGRATASTAGGSATSRRRTPSPPSNLGAELLDVPHNRFVSRPSVRGRGKKRTQSQAPPQLVNLDDTVSLSGGDSPPPRRHSAPPRRHGDVTQAGSNTSPVAGPSGINNRPPPRGAKGGKKAKLNPKTPQPPRRAFHDAVISCTYFAPNFLVCI